jgi:hypothetical protein
MDKPAGSGRAAPGTPPPSAAPPRAILLPPLPGLDALSEPTARLVLTLNRLGTRRESPVLASMYRHLAYWPSYLALSWALIAPLDGDGSLERAMADALEAAGAQAVRLAPRLRATPLDPMTEEAVRAAVEPFAGDVIARMVVICALLRSATGQTEVCRPFHSPTRAPSAAAILRRSR